MIALTIAIQNEGRRENRRFVIAKTRPTGLDMMETERRALAFRYSLRKQSYQASRPNCAL